MKDAPISNSVSAERVKERVHEDGLVSQVVKQGAELLRRTNRPNVITAAQFAPFKPMFNMDKERYERESPDGPYCLEMNRLFNAWRNELGINLYEITIVIASETDHRVVQYLDRRYTRIRSDIVDGKSSRDSVPAAISKTSDTTRDQEILKASVHDIAVANSSSDAVRQHALTKAYSAYVTKKFVEMNLSPEDREKLLDSQSIDTSSEDIPVVDAGRILTILDDDDD